MGTRDGWVNTGDTLVFEASYKSFDGTFTSGLSPTINITNDLSGALLITGGSMTEGANMPIYYYSYVAASAGIYTGLVTFDDGSQAIAEYQVGDGTVSVFDATLDEVVTDTESRDASKADVSLLATSAEISALNNLTAQQVWDYVTRTLTSETGTTPADVWDYANRTLTNEIWTTPQQVWEYVNRTLTVETGTTPEAVWEYATRTLTASSGITEEQFHGYLNSYPASLPPGAIPGVVPAPDNTDLAGIILYCFDNQDNPLIEVNPVIEIPSYYIINSKAYAKQITKWNYNNSSGLFQVEVPEYARVRVKIPEVSLNIAGYVGVGGYNYRADQLFKVDQAPE